MSKQLGLFENSEVNGVDFEVAWKRVVEHFDLLTDRSENLTLLRKAIVSLALQGRLLRQHPEEGTSAQLVSGLSFPSTLLQNWESKPADPLPPSWQWLPLGCLLTNGPKNGYSPKAVEYQTKVKSLTLTATTSGKFDPNFFKYIDETIPESSDLWLRDGDVLVQRGNTIEYVGVAAVYRGPERTFIYPDLMMKFRVADRMDVDFVHMAINSPVARMFIVSRASGTSGSMPKINQAALLSIPIPIPPFREQQRIMALVRKLMNGCDDLEARQTRKRETGTRLTKSALEALTTAEGLEELDTAWKRVVDNFDVLFDRAGGAGELRAAVLDLAVKGRLVPSMKEDGVVPAFASADETPFQLPPAWRWARLESLASHIVDCLHATPRYTATGFPAVRTADVIPGRLLLSQTRLVDDEQFMERIRRLKPEEGDILYSREGERLGIAACVPAGVQVCLSQRMMHIRARPPIVSQYLMWAMNSQFVYRQAVGETGGSTSPHINIKDIRRFLVPVPPPAQQRRIVAKVEHLMKLCDDLEARLRLAEDRAARLAAAAVHHLVA